MDGNGFCGEWVDPYPLKLGIPSYVGAFDRIGAAVRDHPSSNLQKQLFGRRTDITVSFSEANGKMLPHQIPSNRQNKASAISLAGKDQQANVRSSLEC